MKIVLDNDYFKPPGGRYPGQDGDASAANPGHLHRGQYWISSSVTLITDSSLYIHKPHLCLKHLIKRISPRCKVETGGRLRISNMFFPQKHFCVATIIIIMACRHIPTMTKSHHGGNVSVMIKLGMCQCQNPTIQDKVQLGPVGSGKLFNMPPVLRHNISAQLGPSDRTQ